MKKKINMRCTHEQFELLKPKLFGMKFNDGFFNLEEYPYLTNNYSRDNDSGNKCNSIGSRSIDMIGSNKGKIYEEFNAKKFLKACGITTGKAKKLEKKIKKLVKELSELKTK